MNCNECKERSLELIEQKTPLVRDAVLQAHLRQCGECLRFANDLTTVDQLLAQGPGSLQLRDGFVEELMQQAEAMSAGKAQAKPLTIAPWLWIAAAALLAVLGMNAFELKFGRQDRHIQNSNNNAAEDEKLLPSGKVRLPATVDFTTEEKTVYERLAKAEFPSLSCKDTPLAELFAVIAEKAGVDFVLSDDLRQADEPRCVNLELKRPVNGYELLEIVKAQAELRSYVIYDDSVFVRDEHEYDADEFYDVFYDLEPVIQAVADRYPDVAEDCPTENIHDLVNRLTGGDTWENSNYARIESRGNLLIVKQTREVHRDIVSLLRLLSSEPQGFVMADDEAKQYAELEKTKISVPLLEQLPVSEFCAVLQEQLKRDVIFIGWCEGISVEACNATVPTILGLADPALDFYLKNGRLFVYPQGTENVGDVQLAVHSIHEHVKNNIGCEEVVELIQSLVEPRYWENSNDGSILSLWGMLLVNAPPRIHTRVYDTLGKLTNPVNPLAEDDKKSGK